MESVGPPGALLPSDHPFLLLQRGVVPRLDAHPDPPRDQVGAAGQPVRAVALGHPHIAVDRVGLLSLEVAGTVLEPEQVSRRGLLTGGRRGAAEAQLRVAHRDGPEAHPGQVADRVHGDLRVVGARLHADVATAAGREQVGIGAGYAVEKLAEDHRGPARVRRLICNILYVAAGRRQVQAGQPQAEAQAQALGCQHPGRQP